MHKQITKKRSKTLFAVCLCLSSILVFTVFFNDCGFGKWFFITADLRAVERCIEEGADIGSRDKDGVTPLHWAAAYNKEPAVISALLEAGADIDSRTEKDSTPLHWAAGTL